MVRNPRSEREVHVDRNLAIAPIKLWKAARHKLAAMRRNSPLTGRNAYLEQEAQKPQVDTAPMKAKARKLEAKIRKLVKMVEDEPDEELCGGYRLAFQMPSKA